MERERKKEKEKSCLREEAETGTRAALTKIEESAAKRSEEPEDHHQSNHDPDAPPASNKRKNTELESESEVRVGEISKFQISDKLKKMQKRDADIFGTSNWTNKFHAKGCPCCE